VKVNEKENLFLLDKDYEIWGLEEEELAFAGAVSLLLPLPLTFVLTPMIMSLSPFLWGLFLVLIRNYKSKENVRGRVKRKVLTKLERKLLKRDVYYV
jgi:hypothetical protein